MPKCSVTHRFIRFVYTLETVSTTISYRKVIVDSAPSSHLMSKLGCPSEAATAYGGGGEVGIIFCRRLNPLRCQR